MIGVGPIPLPLHWASSRSSQYFLLEHYCIAIGVLILRGGLCKCLYCEIDECNTRFE